MLAIQVSRYCNVFIDSNGRNVRKGLTLSFHNLLG